MYQVLPDQIYLNWPALSTYNPNPKEHNPRVVQAPMVEAAGPYVERDAPYYQNFEQNSYASDDSCHQNQEMQRDMLGCIWPNTWLDRVLLAPSFEPEPLAGGVNYHHEPPAVMMARRIDGLCNLRTPGALPGEAAFSSCNYGSYPPARVMFLNTFGSGPAPQAAAPQMNTVTPGVGYGNDGGGSPVGAGIWAGPPAPSPTDKTMQGASPSDLGLGRSDPGSHHRSKSSHGAPGYDQTCQSVPNGRAMRHSQRGAARDPAVQLERNVRVLAARLLKEGADRVAVNLLCEQIFHSEVSAEALMVKAISRKHSTGMRGKYCLLLRDVKMADGSKGYCCLLCPQSHRKGYKNPQDSIRHFKKAHFGLALDCKGGCDRLFYRQSEMNQHLKTCQVNRDGRSISGAK